MDPSPNTTASAAATAQASSAWAALQAQRPLAARLALLACLPVRVSPALLRQARLRLLPQGSTGDEADLWLCDLVETRTAAGFSYRRAARGLLRAHLRADTALLNSVWQQVYQPHAAWLAPRARLEEALTWHLLHDPTDPAITAHWQAVLHDLGAGPAPAVAAPAAAGTTAASSNPEGVARWLLRAVADLPPNALDHPLAQRAWVGANLLLGDASVLGNAPQAFLASQDFRFATRHLPRRSVFVGLLDGAVLVSPLRPIAQGHSIELPATRPLWLQLEHAPNLGDLDGTAGVDGADGLAGDTAPTQVLTLHNTEPSRVPIHGSAVRLRTLDGSAYLLAPPPAEHAALAQQDQRVQLGYSAEVDGDPVTVQLPLVVGVLADLSGQRAKSTPGLAERQFVDVDATSLDACMQAVAPRLRLVMPLSLPDSELTLLLQFKRLAHFSPAALAQHILRALLTTSKRDPLARLGMAMLLNDETRLLVGKLLRLAGRGASSAKATQQDHAAQLASMARVFDHLDATQQASLLQHLQTLAKQAVRQAKTTSKQSPGDALVQQASTASKRFEGHLVLQVNSVLHHPAFQRLESAWLGLHHLAQRSATGPLLKIRVLDASKAELAQCFAVNTSSNGDAPVTNPLQAKLQDETFGQFGGEPFGLLVGDYAFDALAGDVALLGSIATLAAAVHAPFVAAASPALLGLDHWQGLDKPIDLAKHFDSPALAGWRALRQRDEARYIGLALPRMRSRLPYGADTNPVVGFDFQETVADGQSHGWTNPAYAMAGNITRAFADHGWCARIHGLESGGLVDHLPSAERLLPTDITITDRREAELSGAGLQPLMARPGTGSAVFLRAQPVFALPAAVEFYSGPESAARQAVGWQHLLPACRVMHHLRCLLRDKVGSYHAPEAMLRDLANWLQQYVLDSADAADPKLQLQRPLASADVQVQSIEGRPGQYRLVLTVQPLYQLQRTPTRLVLEAGIALDVFSSNA